MVRVGLQENERRMLEMLAHGMRAKQIACEIGKTPTAIKSRLCRLYRKLGVQNSTAAAAWFLLNYEGSMQNRTDAARQRRAILEGQLDTSSAEGDGRYAHDGPAETRIYLYAMRMLQGHPPLASGEKNLLSLQDSTVIHLLHKWMSGHESALPSLSALLDELAPGSHTKCAAQLVVAFSAHRWGRHDLAWEMLRTFAVELHKSTD